MALAFEHKSRVVGLLGATCSIAAKESLIATLIGSKECHLEHTKLGKSPDIDSGIVLFRHPATQTVYMYVDNGWMLNARFLGRVQETLTKAPKGTAGDGTGHCLIIYHMQYFCPLRSMVWNAGMVESMQNWQSTHKWLHDSEFQLLRRLLVRAHVSELLTVLHPGLGHRTGYYVRPKPAREPITVHYHRYCFSVAMSCSSLKIAVVHMRVSILGTFATSSLLYSLTRSLAHSLIHSFTD